MSAAVLSCREVIDLVTEYLEGTMEARERLSFERHVAICPPCRGYLSQLRQTLRVAGELKEESLSPEVRADLLSAFRHWRGAE